MFTRCPDCRTVFYITAAELRAADGTVVCGACGATFDALESLSETRPRDTAGIAAPVADPAPTPAADPAPTPVADPVAEPVAATAPETLGDLLDDEIEAGARDEDEFLEELESLIGSGEPLEVESFGRELFELEPEMPARDARGFAHDHDSRHDDESAVDVQPEDLPEDAAGDYLPEDPPGTLPEGLPEVAAADLVPEEFFAASPDDDDLPPAHPAGEGPMSALNQDNDELEDFPDPDSVFRIDELEETFEEDPSSPFVSDDATALPAGDAEPDHDFGQAREVDGPDETAAAGETNAFDDTREPEENTRIDARPGTEEIDEASEIATSTESDERTEVAPPAVLADNNVPEEFAPPPPPRGRWARIMLALLGILVLTGAWAHLQHGKLLRYPAGQAVLAPVYATLGITATPDWNPAEFRALRWEAIAAADQPDVLVVAVDFMNAAAYPQPYPVIRVILEGRDGRRVGMHDVPPAQYLEDHANGRRLAANGRVQATVTVPDPGARADGFRLDFCLELPERGLVCGPAPFR